jgi:transposase-like protein
MWVAREQDNWTGSNGYQRSEKALALSIIEMYIQGVSMRKVAKIANELCGSSVMRFRSQCELE